MAILQGIISNSFAFSVVFCCFIWGWGGGGRGGGGETQLVFIIDITYGSSGCLP